MNLARELQHGIEPACQGDVNRVRAMDVNTTLDDNDVAMAVACSPRSRVRDGWGRERVALHRALDPLLEGEEAQIKFPLHEPRTC